MFSSSNLLSISVFFLISEARSPDSSRGLGSREESPLEICLSSHNLSLADWRIMDWSSSTFSCYRKWTVITVTITLSFVQKSFCLFWWGSSTTVMMQDWKMPLIKGANQLRVSGWARIPITKWGKLTKMHCKYWLLPLIIPPNGSH